MYKYVKDINQQTGLCGQVGLGSDSSYYQSDSFQLRDVQQAYNSYWYLSGMAPQKPVTVQDYDDAMQEHLKAQRVARGYTLRQPDVYMDSTNQRWHQDALDWVTHRDAVMTYGLQVQNRYQQGLQVPTLQQFKDNLPVIQWTVEIS